MDKRGAVNLSAVDAPAKELGITNELYEQARHEKRLMAPAVRPEGLVIAVNREARRAALRRAKRLGIDRDPEPIDLRSRRPARSAAEAVERVIDMMLQSQPRLFDGTVDTLSQFLNTYEARILREAHARGLPLPREYVRSALLAIHREGERRRAAMIARVKR